MSLLLPSHLQRTEDEPLAVALRLVRIARELLQAFETHARGRFGLSGGRLGILLALAHAEDGLRPAALAEELNVSRPTVSTLLGGLAAEGLVTRQRDPGDRRARPVRLTRRGRSLVGQVAPLHARRLAALLRALDLDERAQLLRLLEKLATGLRILRGA